METTQPNRIVETTEGLATKLRGQLLQPSDGRFTEECRLWNGMIERHPALIVRPSNVAGNALCDDGLVIDLSRMRAVRVDPVRRTARVEGGATLADVDHETHAHGLATPLGAVPRTGVSGLTLHGGLGFLTRKLGPLRSGVSGRPTVLLEIPLSRCGQRRRNRDDD